MCLALLGLNDLGAHLDFNTVFFPGLVPVGVAVERPDVVPPLKQKTSLMQGMRSVSCTYPYKFVGTTGTLGLPVPSRSMVENPCCAMRIAAADPLGLAPITTASSSSHPRSGTPTATITLA